MTTEKQPAEATPRPWVKSALWIKAKGTGPPIADLMPEKGRPQTQAEADAALIVAAVNDYDRLLRVEAAAQRWNTLHYDEDGEWQGCNGRCSATAALRAALDPTAAGEGR